MPLLNDAKTCYVGTQHISKIMAGMVQVWPKGPEGPQLPACPTCKFWQPTDTYGNTSNAMLIPSYRGDKSKRFQLSPNGVDVDGIAVRMAVSDDKPIYDSQWTLQPAPSYRSSQDTMKQYPEFYTYADAISNQETSAAVDSYTAMVDLKRIWTPEQISKLWAQVSYYKDGYQYNWSDVEYSADNYQSSYAYLPYSQYRAYVGGFYVYRLSHIIECTARFYSGPMPNQDTTVNIPMEIEANGVVRSSMGAYVLSKSPVLHSEGGANAVYMHRYQLIESESFNNSAPAQKFTFQMTSPNLSSDIGLCDVPAT